MLVSVGERISIPLLAMALQARGGQAVSFTGSQSGVITTNEHSEAKIIDVRPARLLQALDQGKVVIAAGFQGVSAEKEITTLGRGGSDTTAAALGIALEAEKVEFYKDVPGICAHNPKIEGPTTTYDELSYEQALCVVEATGGQVLHPRAIKLAAKNALPLHVRPFWENRTQGTVIRSESIRNPKPLYELSPAPTPHCHAI